MDNLWDSVFTPNTTANAAPLQTVTVKPIVLTESSSKSRIDLYADTISRYADPTSKVPVESSGLAQVTDEYMNGETEILVEANTAKIVENVKELVGKTFSPDLPPVYDFPEREDKEIDLDYYEQPWIPSSESVAYSSGHQYEDRIRFVNSPDRYTFNEDKHLQAAWKHIDSTYDSHYSGKVQATELIFSAGHGVGFTIGDIIKYASRLGKKDGFNKKDVYKIIHYSTMLLHLIDEMENNGDQSN